MTCQHLRLKPNVSAVTSVIAIQFHFWGVECEDCGRKWDVGQVLQGVVDSAASEERLRRAEQRASLAEMGLRIAGLSIPSDPEAP